MRGLGREGGIARLWGAILSCRENNILMQPILLVLLPGMDGTGLLFKPLIALLPPAIKPITVRYPGDKVLSYDELLPIALASLPRNGPFVVVGESFSGPLAVRLAAMRPQGLAGLILVATFVTKPWKYARPIVRTFARTPVLRFALPLEQLAARLLKLRTAEHLALSESMIRLITHEVIALRFRMVFDVDVTDDLRRCEVPMLYIQARRDPLVPRGNLKTIQGLKPAIGVAVFETYHQVLQREPQGAADAIASFVSSLPR